MRRFPRFSLSLLTAIVLVLPQAGMAQNGKVITIGTGSVTGVYYPAGGAICRLLNRERKDTGIHCEVESTGGSIANLEALKDKEVDFGIVQSDWQYNAYNGAGVFAGKPMKDLRSVFSLHSEVFTLIARKDSKIHRLADLKGKRVNVGDVGSGMFSTMQELMEEMGWSKHSFAAASELKPGDAAKALCDNKLDALVFTAGQPNGLVQQLTSQCGAVLVPVEGAAVDKLLAHSPYYTRATIPGGMYQGNPQNTPSFGVRATLVTTADMDEESVYQLTKAVFANFDDFKTLHFVFATLEPEHMISSGLTAPLHPGALRYFKEAGLLRDYDANDNAAATQSSQ